jgi:hypothetical protein
LSPGSRAAVGATAITAAAVGVRAMIRGGSITVSAA